MIIKVTKEHIDKGKPKSSGYCPVALAVQEMLKDGYYCAVAPNIICIYKETNCVLTIVVPLQAQGKIKNYDQFGVMEPIIFNLIVYNDCFR